MRRLLACLPAAVLLALPAAGRSAEPVYSIKVSLSREDPDVHTMSKTMGEFAEFFLFLDGDEAKGAEFGIDIQGGQLYGYIIASEVPWVALPMPDPYPGTVAQVRAGGECFDPPLYFGRMLVKPDSPDGVVALNVIPSLRAEQAAILECDNEAVNRFLAYPAAINGEPVAPHVVDGVDLRTTDFPTLEGQSAAPEPGTEPHAH